MSPRRGRDGRVGSPELTDRGGDAPGSHHQTLALFWVRAGGQAKVAHWAWRAGKIKVF